MKDVVDKILGRHFLTPPPNLERMVRLDRSKAIRNLQERLMEVVHRSYMRGTEDAYLRELLQDAIYHELQRLRDQKDKSRKEDLAKKYWNDLRRRLADSDSEELHDQVAEVVARFGNEIHGNFSPSVFQFTTTVIPQAMAFLLNAVSTGALRRQAQHAVNLITNPSFSGAQRFIQDLPSIESQVVIQGELEMIRSLERQGTVVLVPTHVSNMDSVVVGWAINEIGLPPFMYGAGLNLFSNSIISFFMHNLGAYTVDRRKKAELYKLTLKLYATLALEQGIHNLFFPGGTRCRSGEVEKHLKLGLLGTTVHAYIANLQRKKSQPNIYIVPMTMSYQVVMEAETLIDDHLKGVGRSRYIIEDDEFSQVDKWIRFATSLFNLDSKIFMTIGKPLDPFGNQVDGSGQSIDPRGRAIDISRYVMRDGYPDYDAQRDTEYTRELGRSLVESYQKNNRLLITHLTCLTLFTLMEQRCTSSDLFQILRYPWHDEPIPLQDVLENLDRLLVLVRRGEMEGRFLLTDAVRRWTARQQFDQAVRILESYHRKPAIVRASDNVIPNHTELVLYYSNRARGYGFRDFLKGGAGRKSHG